MSQHNDWYETKAKVRITKADFQFDTGMWTVSGYIDLFGRTSDVSITAKQFTHSWFTFGEDFRALEKILGEKCGVDLLGQRKMMAALSKEYTDE